MKSIDIKKTALSLLVAGLAVGFSAFTNIGNEGKLADLYWFDSNPIGDTQTNPTQYLSSDSPISQPCSGASAAYCARGFTLAQTHVVGLYRQPNIAFNLGAPAKKP
ncbi:hypothetical protein [Pedobacter sp. B4-66]|uniref:hypothetical protein n=1 Tax=Pedobacter sp. B4-66 TaxID=2817280 RepID=UPI001BDAD959|nr:hypothetical protein [Pedobacter sp. B4-66]